MPPHNQPTFNKYPRGQYPHSGLVGKNEHPLAFHLAQLRHAYAHLIAERVGKQQEFADGLIAPVIRAIEDHIREDCTRVQESEEA